MKKKVGVGVMATAICHMTTNTMLGSPGIGRLLVRETGNMSQHDHPV